MDYKFDTIDPQPFKFGFIDPRCDRIDPDGDLLLKVGLALGKEHEFKVCSSAMRRASPAWKAMLYGPWKESRPVGDDWVVELPEEDPAPLRIILGMVHGKFELVPRHVSLAQLYDILIPMDKYDMVHMIQPWAHGWVEAVRKPTPPAVKYPDRGDFGKNAELTGYGRILCIHAAWELGCDNLVSAHIVDFVFNFHVSPSDSSAEVKVHYGSNNELLPPFDNYFGPPDLLGKHLINSNTDFSGTRTVGPN